jgi:hypothetical protein
MFLAVQVSYNLYATTMVTSAANDAARRLAGQATAGDADAEAKAELWVRELLGEYGREHVQEVDAERTAEVVRLRVVARNPGFVPLAVRRPLGFDRIDRTVTIRLEREIR